MWTVGRSLLVSRKNSMFLSHSQSRILVSMFRKLNQLPTCTACIVGQRPVYTIWHGWRQPACETDTTRYTQLSVQASRVSSSLVPGPLVARGMKTLHQPDPPHGTPSTCYSPSTDSRVGQRARPASRMLYVRTYKHILLPEAAEIHCHSVEL